MLALCQEDCLDICCCLLIIFIFVAGTDPVLLFVLLFFVLLEQTFSKQSFIARQYPKEKFSWAGYTSCHCFPVFHHTSLLPPLSLHLLLSS